jgi:PEP-CTERM motif
MLRLLSAGILGALVFMSSPAIAGTIPFDTWLQFGFGEAGTAASGCDPADPAGPFCIPSGGTPTTFLDAPPWTFTAGTGGATLTVVDAFLSGDQFEVFDFGASLGLTSLPGAGADCGDDPVVCLANGDISRLVLALSGGLHSLTIVPTLAPDFGGAGYWFVSGTPGTPTSVPEPATALTFALGLAALGALRFRRAS